MHQPHPKFKVLAGSSYDELKELPVNADMKDDGSPPYFEIKTADFEGRIVGNIKGFVDQTGEVGTSKYFDRKDRVGTTWSIQVQGRFLKPVTANDVLFGNTFSQPPRMPWGTSVALQFASFIDPTLSHDLTCERPWALSPMISTMPYFRAVHQSPTAPLPAFDPLAEFDEDVSGLFKDSSAVPKALLSTASQRKKYFQNETHRKEVEFTSETVLHVDFAYGYFQFPELCLSLPGGISFDLKKYWCNQPARFVCCERAPGGTGPGKVFFVVQFDIPDLGNHKSSGSPKGSETNSPRKTTPQPITVPGEKALGDDID
ncbi:hypothetical protein FRB97_007389 [Tulasnella sp. 331]|nr:hypothetical protein FRB97_007389 [Tulasnella sp. 331]